MIALSNHIDGEDRAATSGEILDDLSPATSERIATIPRSGPADVDHGVATLHALPEYGARYQK